MKKEKHEKDFRRKAIYPGGPQAMKAFIRENLVYPEAARREKIEGTVHVQYRVNHLGEVIHARVISGLGHGCDEEALRVVRLLKFTADRNRGYKSEFTQRIGIHFRIREQEAPTSSYQYTISPKKEAEAPDQPDSSTSYFYDLEW